MDRPKIQDNISFYVGPDRRCYRIPKVYLAGVSSFFKQDLATNKLAIVNNSIECPENEIEIFDLFIQWVYSGIIRHHWTGLLLQEEYIKLWLVGNQFMCHGLMNFAMDGLQDLLLPRKIDIRSLDILNFKLIYENTTDRDDYGRKNPLRLFVSNFLCLLDLCQTRARVPRGKQFQRILDEVPGAQKNFDESCDALRMLRLTGRYFDPRIRKLEAGFNHCCFYHIHSVGDICNSKTNA